MRVDKRSEIDMYEILKEGQRTQFCKDQKHVKRFRSKIFLNASGLRPRTDDYM